MKKKVLLASILLSITLASVIGYNILKKNNTENKIDNTIAIYIPNETGTSYVLSNYKTIAETIAAGYIFNESESTCTNGATLTYNSVNNTVIVTSKNAVLCDFKFDKKVYKILSKAGTNLATGDKIAIGDENFWVISNTNGTIRALAEYNLYLGNIYDSNFNKVGEISSSATGYGLQNSSAKGYYDGDSQYVGTVAFGSSSSTYSGSDYEGYINSYISLLVSTYGLNASDISGDAITKTELETLGCSSNSSTCSGSTYPWVYTTSYWSGSAYNYNYVRGVNSNGTYGILSRYASGSDGVRPVVILSESLF